MLKISKLSDYATVLLAHMASHEAAQSTVVLAAATRLAQTTVAKLLKQLAKANLVRATRGAGGGYQLARSATAITVADVLSAMEGPLGLTACSVHNGCNRAGFCRTQSHWHTINQAVLTALRAVSLADLAASNQTQFASKRPMFSAAAHVPSDQETSR